MKIGKRKAGKRRRWWKFRPKSKRPPTLRRRIIRAFSLVVLMSILLTVGVALLSTANEFSEQRNQTSQALAQAISVSVSQQFASSENFDDVDPLLGIVDVPGLTFAEQSALNFERESLSRELDRIEREFIRLHDERARFEDVEGDFYEQSEQIETDRLMFQDSINDIEEQLADLDEDLESSDDDTGRESLQRELERLFSRITQLEEDSSRVDGDINAREMERDAFENTLAMLQDERGHIVDQLTALNDDPGLPGLNLWVEKYDTSEVFQWLSERQGLFTNDGSFDIEVTTGGSLPFPFLNASISPIIDVETGSEIGRVAVSVTDDYFGIQQSRFLEELLFTTLLGSALVGLLSLLMGTWLAWRITAPVTALTLASKSLADEGSTKPLPVTSVDELGQMSASFNQLVDKLQTQRMLRTRLVSDVAHELNTPLSVIQLEAIGIKDGIQAPVDAADQIIQEISMLRNLVYDLNWLGETEVGDVRLDRTMHSIKQLLDSEVERWQSQARARQISLRLQSLPSLPEVSVDALRMGQALGNLLSNALDHTPPDGEVLVSAEMRPIPNQSGEWVVICVKDNGEGIESDELTHIFERFYRTDTARNREQGGRGLGLAIARKLVTLHDGHIWAESTIGKGASFFIAIPSEEADAIAD